MSRNKSTRPLQTREIRTRVTEAIHRRMSEEAARKGVTVTAILKMALTAEYAASADAEPPAGK